MINLVGLGAIFLARILDVTCGTCRILFLVRGRKFEAAILGFFEVSIYMLALGYIFGGGRSLDVPQLLAYAGGFAAGNYLGAMLESRIMNCFILLEIVVEENEDARRMADELRGEGFGVTIITGEGLKGTRKIIKVVCNRRDISRITSLVGTNGFICMSDVKSCWGGHFRMKRV